MYGEFWNIIPDFITAMIKVDVVAATPYGLIIILTGCIIRYLLKAPYQSNQPRS